MLIFHFSCAKNHTDLSEKVYCALWTWIIHTVLSSSICYTVMYEKSKYLKFTVLILMKYCVDRIYIPYNKVMDISVVNYFCYCRKLLSIH